MGTSYRFRHCIRTAVPQIVVVDGWIEFEELVCRPAEDPPWRIFDRAEMTNGAGGASVSQKDPNMDAPRPSLEPPRGFFPVVAYLGPSFILVGSIVGSGELIATPLLGAQTGYTCLWLLLFSCFIKVFFQIEIGRYAISTGKTSLEAFEQLGLCVPGTNLRVNWLGWLWFVMVACAIVQQGAMVAGTTQALRLAGLFDVQYDPYVAAAISVGTSLLLLTGRYSVVERVTMILVAMFTAATIFSVIRLQFTDFAVTGQDLVEGMRFQLPSGAVIAALTVFGITGVGASELIAYPYWCLEKGYGRLIGPADQSESWAARARGWVRVMSIDAWSAMLIFTLATMAFFFLAAAILHPQYLVDGILPARDEMIEVLSAMYASTFGAGTKYVFIAGAIAVLYSTLFVATAAHSRMLTDWFGLLGLIDRQDAEKRRFWIAALCVILPQIATAAVLTTGEPVFLVIVSGVAQSLLLPFLGAAILTLSYRRTDKRIRGGIAWHICLWVAYLLMSAGSVFMLYKQLFL